MFINCWRPASLLDGIDLFISGGSSDPDAVILVIGQRVLSIVLERDRSIPHVECVVNVPLDQFHSEKIVILASGVHYQTVGLQCFELERNWHIFIYWKIK